MHLEGGASTNKGYRKARYKHIDTGPRLLPVGYPDGVV
jgi:hypothetical protein